MDDLTLPSKAGAYPGETPKCAFSKILDYPMMKKHSSLFVRGVSDADKMFHDINTCFRRKEEKRKEKEKRLNTF